eukprot:CAMPEP_0172447100 /NCGR_PEP_ID=MMETSP1065-20121228/6475_1 /TAXON_ID=265537 /ORGANISM="Amphiprora paludosa, Strain CCMP125" /LENGTH=184 /DNA_ID=CAMNT_0013198315 /DNA_START=122 /DNA_END=676 /DNA_ORIENTATION=+
MSEENSNNEASKKRAQEVANFLNDEDDEEAHNSSNTTKVLLSTTSDVENQEESFVDEPLDDNNNNEEDKDGVLKPNASKSLIKKSTRLGSVRNSNLTNQNKKKQPKRRPRPTVSSELSPEREEDMPILNRILVVLGFMLIFAVGIVLLTRDPKHDNDDDNQDLVLPTEYENGDQSTGGQSDLFN